MDSILSTLDCYGFEADGPLVFQSDRLPAYEAALEELQQSGLAYPCSCTRKEIADSVVNRSSAGELRYPGTCRFAQRAGRQPRAWRLRVDNLPIQWVDRLQGPHSTCLDQDLGDFVIARADGIFSYQLAVVVDDFAQGINEVVRGADLLDSTARQIYLQRALGIPPPSYLHIPVATGPNGDKLSKQNLAQPLAPENAAMLLLQALSFLGQQPPQELSGAAVKQVWAWALAHWREQDIPATPCCPADPTLC